MESPKNPRLPLTNLSGLNAFPPGKGTHGIVVIDTTRLNFRERF